MKNDKGPTRAQLQAKIVKLEAELAKYRRGDTVRKVGEHWYELSEYFDGDQIRRIPAPAGPTFLMGMLSDMFVVEYPADAPMHELREFMRTLSMNGIKPCLAVRSGVRFLKLTAVDEEMERRLDAAEVKGDNEASPAAAGDTDNAGDAGEGNDTAPASAGD